MAAELGIMRALKECMLSSRPTMMNDTAETDFAPSSDYAERIAFGWDIMQGESARLVRFAVEMQAMVGWKACPGDMLNTH